ncbi:hypothetical protein Tco_1494630 [Tanacetum coccineum]
MDFQGMPELMRDGLFARILMEHRDDAGVVVFTSRAWGRLFDTRGPLVWEILLEFLSTLRFGEVLLDLDAPNTIQFQLGRARRRLSLRQFILALGLHTREEMESLGFARMMAHNIVGRSQAPEKVTVTDLFYLRGMDVGSFIARLAEHFGLLIAKILGGLTVVALELLIIDMAERVRLQICMEVDDTWAWVAMGPKRQPDAADGAHGVAQDAPAVDEGGQADPRMARLEEDVHEIRRTLAEQREVISAMARDFSRFCTWTTTSLARMMDRLGVTYTSYSKTPR